MPCPFCGKTPSVVPAKPKVEGNAWGAVECRNKRCASYNAALGHGARVTDGAVSADERGPDEYKNAAIRRWNKRSS